MNPLKLIFQKILPALFLVGAVFFMFSLPRELFNKPTSTVLYASNGELLNASISMDEQWRFPPIDTVPEKFKKCILAFEDRHFYDHNGVYLPSVARAMAQNFSRRKVVSGASTLSMQVIRMSRNNPGRTWFEKILEMVRALRLETLYSKDEILALYASNAPFGGNVVGIEAAAWRYFARTPSQLSWAESAVLAVLPNAPSLIFPGKNQEQLMVKRNRLLENLMESGIIDRETYELSCIEPLPQKPFPLPQRAPHLLNAAVRDYGKGKSYHTTIRALLQDDVIDIVRRHIALLSSNQVHNAAVIVLEPRTGKVLAYVGNAEDAQNRYGNQVDVIRAPRSTGSIMKPILYAAMLKDGLILPNTLLADIPVQYDGFAPKNYSRTFDGAVPASQALSRSLNVPAVMMLRDYGYPRFFHLLKKMGFEQLTYPADHYGLALILGGAEATLWEVTNSYAAMSRTLSEYHGEDTKYNSIISTYLEEGSGGASDPPAAPLLDAGSTWCTYNALLEVNRPESEAGWELIQSNGAIAWKTGTSFGNRDAWAVGSTPEYIVGVWVGNADGQGRPELTGVQCAAPLMFEVFSLLNQRTWYPTPYDDLEKIAVCHESGMRAGPNCNHVDKMYVPRGGLISKACTYHKLIHLDSTEHWRVNAGCYPASKVHNVPWFVLPTVQEYYYKSKHPEYMELPPVGPGCAGDDSPVGLIYPNADSKLYVPRNLAGKMERIVLEATHRDPAAILYWHINGIYIGQTQTIHQMEIPSYHGTCRLTIVDQDGATLERNILFVDR